MFSNTRRSRLLVLIAVTLQGVIIAQDVEMAKSRSLSALRRSSLVGGGMHPYHLKASITTYDGAGKNPSSGKVEVWSRDRSLRVSITFPDATDQFLRSAGASYSAHVGELPYFAPRAVWAMLDPVKFNGFSGQPAVAEHRLIGGIQTDCISIAPTTEAIVQGPLQARHEVCLNPTNDQIESVVDGQQILMRQDRFNFDDHEAARKLTLMLSEEKIVEISIDVLENVDLTPDDFKPSADMQKLDIPLELIPGSIMAGRLVKHENPKYPGLARAAHIQGTVVLRAIIGKDGRIGNLSVVSSPDRILSEASLKAVQNWTYDPYLLNGEPTQVDTTISVTFSMGGH